MNSELLLGSGTVSNIDLFNGLIALYPLNDDSQSKDYTATYDSTEGGTITYSDLYATFNGTNSYLDNTTLSLDGTHTMSGWVSLNALPTTTFPGYNFTIVSCRSASSTGFSVVFANNPAVTKGIEFVNRDSSITVTEIGTRALFDYTVGVQYFITVKISTTNVDIYIDNQLYSSYTLSSPYINTGNFTIGKEPSSDVYYLNGNISNFKVYNRIINDIEQTSLYNEGLKPQLPQPTTDGLVAHYPLTGTAEDETGNYDGTENGGLLYIDDAEKGSVASFDGVDDYVNISSISGALIYPFTVSTWLYCNVTDSTVAPGIITGNTADAYITVFVNYSNGIIKQHLRSSSAAGIDLNTFTVTTSGWYHVIAIFESGNFSLTVNNTTTTNTLVLAMPSINNAYFNRLLRSATDTKYKGYIGSTRIYGRTLTVNEIADIYNYEKVTHPIAVDNNLIAYYPLANNSLDNYYHQYDSTDAGVTYDGTSVQVTNATYIRNNNLLAFKSSYASFSIWYKNTNSTTYHHWFSICDYSDWGNAFNIGLYGGFVSYQIRNTGNNPYFIAGTESSTLTADGLWHNIVVQKSSNGNVEIFFDGVKQTVVGIYESTPYNSSIWYTDNAGVSLFDQVAIGATYRTGGIVGATTGSIAKFRPYIVPLTDQEIQDIYNTEKGDFGL